MNIPDIYKEIITDLSAKTEEGLAKWSTTGRSGAFLIQFTNFGLLINHYEDQNSESVIVKLIDNNGEQIDSFEVYAGEDEFWLVNQMYILARRNALNIDKAIMEIRGELKTKKIVGTDKSSISEKTEEEDTPF